MPERSSGWSACFRPARTTWSLLVVISLAVGAGNAEDTGDDITTPPSKLWQMTYTDRLKQDLLTGYDKFVPPTYYGPIDVVIVFRINYASVDVFSGQLDALGQFMLEWQDQKLTWDPRSYGNATLVHVSGYELWVPDLVNTNSVDHSFLEGGETRVDSTGMVRWTPMLGIHVPCAMDLRGWPFDTHICKIYLSSSYGPSEIKLQISKMSTFPRVVSGRASSWNVLNETASTNSQYGPTTILIEIKLQRRPGSLRMVIAPATVVVACCLASFWLPALSAERLVLCGINLTVIGITLLYLSQLIPITAAHSPLVLLLYVWCLYLVCLSIVLCCLLGVIPRLHKNRALYPAVSRALSAWPARALTFKFRADQTEIEDLIPGSSRERNEWQRLAVVLDRLFFIFYCIVLTTVTFMYTA